MLGDRVVCKIGSHQRRGHRSSMPLAHCSCSLEFEIEEGVPFEYGDQTFNHPAKSGPGPTGEDDLRHLAAAQCLATQVQTRLMIRASRFGKLVDLFRAYRCISGGGPRSSVRLKRTGAKIRQRSEEHTSELQSRLHLVCRLLLEK